VLLEDQQPAHAKGAAACLSHLYSLRQFNVQDKNMAQLANTS